MLDFLDARGVRGTFFVVGETADDHPDLVREIADARPRDRPARLAPPAAHRARRPTRSAPTSTRGKALLEELAGTPVVGFRAPTFSLVPESRWAVDVLARRRVHLLVERAARPQPAVRRSRRLPATPFRWPNGLVELPCPVVRAGGVGLPYLGGVYLRAHPGAGVGRSPGASVGRDQLLWIYCHPYDFDPDEQFWVVPDAGRLGSRLLWYNRRRTFAKIEAMLRGRAGPPLAERLDRGRHAAHD